MCVIDHSGNVAIRYGKANPTYGLTHDGQYCFMCCPGCKKAETESDPLQPFGMWQSQVGKLMNQHFAECHDVLKTNSHVGNGAPTGPFAFTLTKSPADNLTEEDMIKSVKKLMKQKSCPVVKYAWYLEYGDEATKQHPHIHGMYETDTGGRIESKHFKRAWPIWDPKIKMGKGHRGGYHRPVRAEEAYTDYIKDYGHNTVGECRLE